MTDSLACPGCGIQDHPGQWWYLSRYHGVSGRFCADCYKKISHDAHGQPNQPNEYLMMLLKLGSR